MTMTGEIMKDDYEPEEGEIQDDDDISTEGMRLRAGERAFSEKKGEKNSTHLLLFHRDDSRAYLRKQDNNIHNGRQYYHQDLLDDNYTTHGTSRSKFHSSFHRRFSHKCSKDWNELKFSNSTNRPRQLRELRRTSSSYYSSYSPKSERRSSNVSLSGNTFSSSVPTRHWYRKRSKAKNKPHKSNSIVRSPNPKDIAKNSPPASSGDSNANFNVNKIRDTNNEIIEDGQNMGEKESQDQTFPDSLGTADGIEIIVLPPKVPEIITLSDSDEEHSKIEENAPKTGDEMQVSSFFNNEKNQLHISNDCAVAKTEKLECTADRNYDNLQDRELKSKPKNVSQENMDESQKSVDISSSNPLIDFENQAQNILFDSSNYPSNICTPSNVQEKNLLGDIQSYISSSTAIENIYTDTHNFFIEKELQSQVTSQSCNPKNGIQKTPFKSFTFSLSQNSCSPRASCIPANLYEESSVLEFVIPGSKCVTDINTSCKKSEYINSPVDSLKKWVKDCFPTMNIQDERNCDSHKSSDITSGNELPYLNSINSNNVIQECNVYAENEVKDMIVEIKENSYEDEKIVKMNSQSNVATECIHRLQSQSQEKNTQESLEQTNDRANSLDQRKGVNSVSNNIFVDNIKNTSQNIQIAPCLKSTTLQINQSPDKIVGNDSLVQTEMYLDKMSCKNITENEEKTLYQRNIKFPSSTEVGSVSALKRRANELRKLKKNNLHAKALKLTEITKNEKIHSLNVDREKSKDSSKTLYSQPSHSVERINFLEKCGNNTNILGKHNISSKSGNKHLECSDDIVSGKCFAYSKNILIYEDRLGSRNNDVGSFREKFSQRINVTVPEFIINLGKESDSEDDSEEESIGNHSKDDKKEIINNQNNSNTSQPVGTEFEKKLDILLKQARSQQELNADNKEINEQLVSSVVYSHTKENSLTLPTRIKVNQGCARVTPKTTAKKLTCSSAGKVKLMNQKMKSVVVRNITSNLHRDKNISYDMNRNNSLSTFITSKHAYKGWSKCAPSRGKINCQTPTMANINLLPPVKQKEYLKLKKQIVQMTQNKKRDKNRSSGRLEQTHSKITEKIEMGSSKDMKEHLPSCSKIEVHSQKNYALDCYSKLDSNFENRKENQSSFSIPQIVGTHEKMIPNVSSAKPKDYFQKTVLESSMELHSQNEANFTTQELLADKNRNNFENIKFQTHKERGTEDKRRDEGIECITSGTATKETMCNSLIHSQVVEDLWSAETKLISKRRQVLEDIATVRLSLHKIDAVNFKKSQILKNIHQLKEELKRAEEHLNIETEYLKTLNIRVDDSKHNIHKGQCELLTLSLECEDLGCKVHGLNYNVPNTCVDLIRTEMLAMNKAMQELENQKKDA